MEQSVQCSSKTQKKQIKLKWVVCGRRGRALGTQLVLVRIRTSPNIILKEGFASNLKNKETIK